MIQSEPSGITRGHQPEHRPLRNRRCAINLFERRPVTPVGSHQLHHGLLERRDLLLRLADLCVKLVALALQLLALLQWGGSS